MILLRPKEDLAVVISSVAILGVCHDYDDADHDDDEAEKIPTYHL